MPIKRLLQKAKLVPIMRRNKVARAHQKMDPLYNVLRIGYDSPEKIEAKRRRLAETLNRSRGKGKNSSWKLTGIRRK